MDFPDLLDKGSEEHPHRKPRFPFRAVAIMDEFSHSAWATEFEMTPITPSGWPEEIANRPDFLFVESAWEGNNGAWRYQLTGSRAPSDALRQLVASCRENGIPTVFWNKEDPPHFEDFLDTAQLFDVVFTTDSNKLDNYRGRLGHDRVHVLPFAAQPRLHNPARNGLHYAAGDTAFAGTYFQHKFDDRREQMDLLLGAAVDVARSHGLDFTIFSRHAGKDAKYQFPEPFADYVVGALPYSRMLSAYRSFKLFLNVNSVVDSPSMCARRIFEICASGTVVLSTPSEAVHRFFAEDEVPVVRTREHARRMIRALWQSPELRERMVHRSQRRIWENHTYRHRALTILEKLNLSASTDEHPRVSVICSTNRDASLDHLFSQVAHQSYPNVELIVLGHGIDFEPTLQQRAEELGITLTQIAAPSEATLGECLNKLVDTAQGDIIAKFDDDDHYRPNYLRDQVLALQWSEADLVGKASIFFHLAEHDLVARRWPQKEHRWTNFVAGATLVGWRSLFLKVRFRALERGEDSQFLRDLEEAGATVYSADRFNYMAVRQHSDQHTWDISDAEILSYSTVETSGKGLDHISV